MKQSVTVGAQLLWGGRYGYNNGLGGGQIKWNYKESVNSSWKKWIKKCRLQNVGSLFRSYGVNPPGFETVIFRENRTMVVANDLAPCVAKSSASVVLT